MLVSVAGYSRQADAYEAAHRSKMHEPVGKFAQALPVPSRVLDAGCGPGRDLARFVAYGHTAYGVDLNPDFVAKARAQAPTWLADLRHLDTLFPPGQFDGIWACASLVHLDRKETSHVLRQFALLLRPAGKLYACVNTVGTTGWLDEPDAARWYQIWEHDSFASAVAQAGFVLDQVDRGPFVEVWATRATRASGRPGGPLSER